MGCTSSVPAEHEELNKVENAQRNVTKDTRTAVASKAVSNKTKMLNKSNTKTKNKNKKYDYESILSSPGQLEIPERFQKWFPEGHGHKRVRRLFKWHKELGHGVTGAVYEIEYKGKICAVKQVEKESFVISQSIL